MPTSGNARNHVVAKPMLDPQRVEGHLGLLKPYHCADRGDPPPRNCLQLRLRWFTAENADRDYVAAHQPDESGRPSAGCDRAERISRQLQVVHDADRNAVLSEQLAVQQV
jgi:hypothetical protein